MKIYFPLLENPWTFGPAFLSRGRWSLDVIYFSTPIIIWRSVIGFIYGIFRGVLFLFFWRGEKKYGWVRFRMTRNRYEKLLMVKTFRSLVFQRFGSDDEVNGRRDSQEVSWSVVEPCGNMILYVIIYLGAGNSKIFSMFIPILGKWSNLTSIFFQRGWNHQLDIS